MSGQEAMFEPQQGQQAKQSPQASPVEAPRDLPREQQYWHAAQIDAYAPSYEEGYVAQQHYPGAQERTGQAAYRQQQSNEQRQGDYFTAFWQKNRVWLLFLLIPLGFLLIGAIPVILSSLAFLLVLAAVGAAIFVGFLYLKNMAAPKRTIVLPTKTFQVQGIARLEINNRAGSITIRRGEAQRVEVKGMTRVRDAVDAEQRIEVIAEQKADVITVFVRDKQNSWPMGWDGEVELEVIVPETSDLRVEQNAGNIRVDGIRGQLQASTNAGMITLQQITLRGDSKIKANAGGITFAGQLDPQGKYAMTANAGSIDIAVPKNSSFEVHTILTAGVFQNGFASNKVGQAPHAQLRLQANAGSIKVRPM